MKKIDLVKTTAKLIGTAALSTSLLAQSVDARPRQEYKYPYHWSYKAQTEIEIFPHPDSDWYVWHILRKYKKLTDYSNANLLSLIDSNNDGRFNKDDKYHKEYVMPALKELGKNLGYRDKIANPFFATNIIRHIRKAQSSDKQNMDLEQIFATATDEAKEALASIVCKNPHGDRTVAWVDWAMRDIVIGKYGLTCEENQKKVKGEKVQPYVLTKQQKKEYMDFLSLYNQVALDLEEFGIGILKSPNK